MTSHSVGDKVQFVALLAEGVDRNLSELKSVPHIVVALLAEGVDRNIAEMSCNVTRSRSPSSRRAWIEILYVEALAALCAVALLAEGVDRNWHKAVTGLKCR